MQVLVVNTSQDALPDGTGNLLTDIGWHVTTAEDFQAAAEAARHGLVDAVIMAEPRRDVVSPLEHAEFEEFVRQIKTQRIAALMLTDEPPQDPPDSGSLVAAVSRDIGQAELRGRLAMIERYHGLLKLMDQELRNMERLGKRLAQHFREVDQEMRLAGRLQRDFLPELKEPIGNAQFATIYRPATWVSGDMFDIVPIDEEHTGIYVADAVGHGVAAGLLTMFIKRSIAPRRLEGDHQAVQSPSQIIAALNTALTDQSLPNCQFVTACYALLNHRTLMLRYARGGHPYPMLINTRGGVTELRSPGGLLGLSKEEQFPTAQTQLRHGDKVLFYTDGVELAFQSADEHADDPHLYQRVFQSLSPLAIQELMRRLEARLDDNVGSLTPRDDVTIVGLEILDR